MTNNHTKKEQSPKFIKIIKLMSQKKVTSSFFFKNYHAQAIEIQEKKKKKGNLKKKFILIQFSPHFGGLEEKTPESHNLFFFLLTQTNILRKSFHFHFFSEVFHLSCFTSKQTHTGRLVRGNVLGFSKMFKDSHVLLQIMLGNQMPGKSGFPL